MKEKLRAIIDDNTTFNGRIVDYIIQFLIVTTLVAYTFETLPDNSLQTKVILKWVEIISIIIFTIEYILRIYVAKNPFKYIFSFFRCHRLLSNITFFPQHSIGLNAIKSVQDNTYI